MGKRIFMGAVILLFMSLSVKVDAKSTKTSEDIYRTIRDSLVAHEEEVTIEMGTKTLKEIINADKDLFQSAIALDDKTTSKDADYLYVTVAKWKASWKWDNVGNARLTFSAEYRSTLNQEKKLEEKIKSILEELDISDASDYEKVKAIHDYIINRASYDESLQKRTAYNLLINKSAVCQGYAAAAYRMFTDAGLESKIILGTAGGGAHVWNIVKVDGKWYNIDLTWDDPETSSGKETVSYDYFLKSTKDFSDHERNPEYKTKEFIKEYPIAAKSYKISE